MNKVTLYFACFTVALFSLSCDCNDCDSRLYTTSATIYLINETSEVVKSGSAFNYVIQPGDTLVHKESFRTEHSSKPTTQTYQPFPTSYLFFYGDGTKCEFGLRDIENYEKIKEVVPLVFELTFRFTEERKAKAELCN
jgi:hypothetical protein